MSDPKPLNADGDEAASPAVASRRTLEAITATVLFGVGVLVIVDSVRVGRGWASDGPMPGFYPFYIGLILCLSSVAILVQQVIGRRPGDSGSRPFIRRDELGHVLAIFVPTVLYIAAIYLVGLYVASAVFLVAFMRWQGHYGWLKSLPLGIGVPLVLFALFELWFKVPLPKGPLEAALGY